jgi:putative transposase
MRNVTSAFHKAAYAGPMARARRPNLPGVPQHVVQRGNNRQTCFFNNSDYTLFLEILSEACQKHTCHLHAYVLMTNHVHLLITPDEGNGVSHLMMNVGRRHVRSVNDRYGRTGTLWEGRFKSSIIDSASSCIACYRYIEMNPVCAKMVQQPQDYAWSSFHVNALGEESGLITPHAEWLSLGRNEVERRRAYQDLFKNERNPS